MYNYQDIKTVHLETTSRCQASCPMCVRNLHGGIENPWLELDEITLAQFKEWFPIEFIKQLNRLYMCGNTGDPIVAKDTLEIFKYLREVNPAIHLSMNTNGSAKDIKWWQELAIVGVRVIFGIDGLEDTHTLYRIGTDWHKIITNAQHFIHAGGEAEWHMLVFKHNEHQIDECQSTANNIGFNKFTTKHTSRFSDNDKTVLNKDGTTSHILQPSSRSQTLAKKLIDYNAQENTVINCKALEEKSIYINAHGEVTACCWLDFRAVPPFNASLVDFRNNKFVNLNLKTSSLEQIFESMYFKKIEEQWSTTPLLQCSKQCGKIDKFKEQFND
jgi:MoaA/NifB/PqqE/SkfB family radical SAM enzyme